MALNTKSFDTLVSDMITSIQARSDSFLKFAVGSILRAIVEGTAGVVLWIQGLILALLGISRASTCTGSDLDSWMADFGLVRVTAIPATGTAAFSRFSAGEQVVVPLGTSIESADGTKKYLVSLDITNVAYNSGLGGYVIDAADTSVVVPIVAVSAGSYSNAVIGEINTITTVVVGVDTVSNPTNINNGLDTETDDMFRARFILALSALARATQSAVSGVVAPVRPGLKYNIVENFNFDGSENDGYFYVVVDDGTGYPAPQVLADVAAAVEDCRPLTSKFDVYAPQVLLVNVTFDIVTPPVLSHTDMTNSAKIAVTDYINSLGLGERLSFTRLSKVIYDSDSNIINVLNLAINSTTLDVVPSVSQVLKSGIVVVN